MFSYFKNPHSFLEKIKTKLNVGGRLLIRQYDGSLLRIGPMDEETRRTIDESLYSSIALSDEFKHYDMDRVLAEISTSSFSIRKIDFETFYKTFPFSQEVRKYIIEHIMWLQNYVNDYSSELLQKWVENNFERNSYFLGIDLIAVLSLS